MTSAYGLVHGHDPVRGVGPAALLPRQQPRASVRGSGPGCAPRGRCPGRRRPPWPDGAGPRSSATGMPMNAMPWYRSAAGATVRARRTWERIVNGIAMRRMSVFMARRGAEARRVVGTTTVVGVAVERRPGRRAIAGRRRRTRRAGDDLAALHEDPPHGAPDARQGQAVGRRGLDPQDPVTGRVVLGLGGPRQAPGQHRDLVAAAHERGGDPVRARIELARGRQHDHRPLRNGRCRRRVRGAHRGAGLRHGRPPGPGRSHPRRRPAGGRAPRLVARRWHGHRRRAPAGQARKPPARDRARRRPSAPRSCPRPRPIPSFHAARGRARRARPLSRWTPPESVSTAAAWSWSASVVR